MHNMKCTFFAQWFILYLLLCRAGFTRCVPRPMLQQMSYASASLRSAAFTMRHVGYCDTRVLRLFHVMPCAEK